MTHGPLEGLGPEEKRALLKRLLAERAAGAAGAPDAAAGDVGDVGDYPLSHGQRALWFLQRLLPDTYAYHVAFAGRLRPALDLAAFRRALDRLAARHPALRTVFPDVDGQPIQRVRPPSAAPLRVVEMPDAADDAVRDAIVADYRRPFDLATSPWAVTVYRRAGEDALLVDLHHLVVDAWSLQVLLEDLRALYAEESLGTPAALPPVAARYVDFVASEAQMLGGARGAALWAYWERTLAGEIPPLAIPSAPPRPPAVRLVGASVPFACGPELSAAVYALARARGATLYAVLVAAAQLLLSRLGGRPDVVVGSPVSVRPGPEFERVVGYFVNTVPVRGRVRQEESFADLLVRVREQVAGALDHQELPFPLLVDRLQARREANRNPIFQTLLNVLVAPRPSEFSRLFSDGERAAAPFGSSRLTPHALLQGEGQFELTLEVMETAGELHGQVRYQTDVYDAETAREVRDTFLALLAAVTARPDAPVAELLGAAPREDFEL